MTIHNLPLYELMFDDNDSTLGCSKISLVEEPAVEEFFLKFSKDVEEKEHKSFYFKDDSKHIVTGIAMRADYPIYRNQDGQEFYVQFSKDTIEKMMQKFMKEQRLFDISLDHNQDVRDCYLIESFIINKERGICPNEFSDVEDGSWIISVKIENKDVWDKICSGEVKGFSIETEMIASAFSNQKQKAKEIGISVDELTKLFSIFK